MPPQPEVEKKLLLEEGALQRPGDVERIERGPAVERRVSPACESARSRHAPGGGPGPEQDAPVSSPVSRRPAHGDAHPVIGTEEIGQLSQVLEGPLVRVSVL